MSYRFMRIIVFFDLPTVTETDKREYRKFRRTLIKNGFIMLQESVYIRMVLNQSVQKSTLEYLKNHRPAEGMVQALVITEKQFAGMVNIIGKTSTDIIDTDERLVIL